MKKEVTLWYLFLTFLKIGATSWGGFMALISVVQKNLVEKDKIISDEEVLDGISLASVLPGPVAFNVVTFLGYRIKGMKGALVSMAGIILPSFFLILLLTYFYLESGDIPAFKSFFAGVLPAVSAIIISVALKMTKKNIKDYKQYAICIVSLIVLIFMKALYTTFLIIFLGGLVGFLLYRNNTEEVSISRQEEKPFSIVKLILFLITLTIVSIVLWYMPEMASGDMKEILTTQKEILFTLSGMSLTLFGGGYVIIPMIQEVVVENLGWLNDQEFVDAIAMGQITPGPIFISATFIGYKVGGLWGAITATLAIFLPPGFLMIFASGFMTKIKQSKNVTAIFKGLRPAVIGMIFAASYTIGKSVEMNWITLFIFAFVLIASIRFKINVIYLIPVSGIFGLILYSYV
jgi:chromate transporter